MQQLRPEEQIRPEPTPIKSQPRGVKQRHWADTPDNTSQQAAAPAVRPGARSTGPIVQVVPRAWQTRVQTGARGSHSSPASPCSRPVTTPGSQLAATSSPIEEPVFTATIPKRARAAGGGQHGSQHTPPGAPMGRGAPLSQPPLVSETQALMSQLGSLTPFLEGILPPPCYRNKHT